ncbi:MAG: DUF362 domain-containing protein [Acidobacteriia bacterium]|nr:DUF362 domain-containing protein [Terriglobia bacterium]
MTRREWLATLAAAPLLKAAEAPAAPVSIVKCASYEDDVTVCVGKLFDQLGGLPGLVRNKTVTIKLNMTGPPAERVQGRAPGLTHYVHPKVVGAVAYHMGRAGARRIRFVESAWASGGPLEETMMNAGWNVRALQSAAAGVEFENTNALGKSKTYARFPVPGNAYMYPAYDLNHAFADTDVFVSLAKLKNHDTCGVTLSLKNCFGSLPASIYGDDAGVDEPNESPRSGRLKVGHEGRRQPSKSAPQELHFGASHDPGYRVPHIVADLAAARPIHPPSLLKGRRTRTQLCAAGEAGRHPGGSEPRLHRCGRHGRDGVRPARGARRGPFPELRQHAVAGGSPRRRRGGPQADRRARGPDPAGHLPLRVAQPVAGRALRPLHHHLGAPTAVFRAEGETNLVARDFALVDNLIVRALVVGCDPEGDAVARDLALLHLHRRGLQPFHFAGQSITGNLHRKGHRNRLASEIELPFPYPAQVRRRDGSRQQDR